MARKPRKESSLKLYHVILRGNNRQSIFFDDVDREFFIGRVFKYADQLRLEVYSYCLMGNHVHLLIGNASKKELSLFVQKFANSYVYFFNHKYDCSGHLFQGRFKSEPIEDEIYFKNILRYILMNPEKANIAKMKNYKWSSYRYLVEKENQTKLACGFVISVFGSVSSLRKFLYMKDDEQYMEYENKLYFSDNEAREFVLEKLKTMKLQKLQEASKYELKQIISGLRSKNSSISQICRISGLPKKIIIKL